MSDEDIAGYEDAEDETAESPDEREVRYRRAAQLAGDELLARAREVEAADQWDYEAILVRARAAYATLPPGAPGRAVADYLALSRENDPFYIGTPADWIEARWVAEVYPQLGYTRPAHIRAVHYAIRIRGTFTLPNGTPCDHEHQDVCWPFIQSAVGKARYLGLLPWDRILDNRNPPPRTEARVARPRANASVDAPYLTPPILLDAPAPPDLPDVPTLPWLPPIDTLPVLGDEGDDDSDLPDMPEGNELPSYRLDEYDGAQRYRLVVVCEKSTMNDLLEPWCVRHQAELVTGEGELTITAVWRATQRIIEQGAPTAILYVSDFDFKGRQMPVSFARKVQRFLRDTRAEGRDVPEVVLLPAVLTIEQVRRFALPDETIADSLKVFSKGKRKGQDRAQWRKWQALYGPDQGFVELDAVEGSREGRLGRLLDEAAAAFYDRQLSSAVFTAQQAVEARLREDRDATLSAYEDDLNDARAGWELARAEAEHMREEAWQEASTLIRAPLDEARTLLTEAWQEAMKGFIPVWRKARELVSAPREEASTSIRAAQDEATATLREAWTTVRDTMEQVGQALRDNMSDLTADDLAPPLGSEAPDEVLDAALFYSLRPMTESLRVFHLFQGRIAGEDEDGDGEGGLP
jgi:hypothetical protein